jgi:hypothetical protein
LSPLSSRASRVRAPDSETRRHWQSGGRQLTEVGALTSNESDISKTDLLEPANRIHHRGNLCSQFA